MERRRLPHHLASTAFRSSRGRIQLCTQLLHGTTTTTTQSRQVRFFSSPGLRPECSERRSSSTPLAAPIPVSIVVSSVSVQTRVQSSERPSSLAEECLAGSRREDWRFPERRRSLMRRPAAEATTGALIIGGGGTAQQRALASRLRFRSRSARLLAPQRGCNGVNRRAGTKETRASLLERPSAAASATTADALA